MNEKLISVIVPVYKVEKYLAECIESIINQEYKNIEVILVDDGSPDNCPTICDEYAKKDSRVKVIHQKNQGVSVARNAGIDIATGEYIVFVDSDDILLPEWSNAVKKIEAEDFIVFTKGFYVTDKEDLCKKALGINEPSAMTPWARAYRREFLIDKNIRFRPGIVQGQDGIFNFECAKYLTTFGVIENKTYKCRNNPTFTTHVFKESIVDNMVFRHNILKEILIDMKNVVNTKEIEEQEMLHSIVVILLKMSMIKSFKEYKRIAKRFYEKSYIEYLFSSNIFLKRKQRILILLLQKKMFFVMFLVSRIWRKLKMDLIEREFIET